MRQENKVCVYRKWEMRYSREFEAETEGDNSLVDYQQGSLSV